MSNTKPTNSCNENTSRDTTKENAPNIVAGNKQTPSTDKSSDAERTQAGKPGETRPDAARTQSGTQDQQRNQPADQNRGSASGKPSGSTKTSTDGAYGSSQKRTDEHGKNSGKPDASGTEDESSAMNEDTDKSEADGDEELDTQGADTANSKNAPR